MPPDDPDYLYDMPTHTEAQSRAGRWLMGIASAAMAVVVAWSMWRWMWEGVGTR
jgi:hypothetical protein